MVWGITNPVFMKWCAPAGNMQVNYKCESISLIGNSGSLCLVSIVSVLITIELYRVGI